MILTPIRTNNKQKSYYSPGFVIQTEKKLKSYRPDIRIIKEKHILLIDMSVSMDNDISVKEYNKISKFRTLETEIKKYGTLKLQLYQ